MESARFASQAKAERAWSLLRSAGIVAEVEQTTEDEWAVVLADSADADRARGVLRAVESVRTLTPVRHRDWGDTVGENLMVSVAIVVGIVVVLYFALWFGSYFLIFGGISVTALVVYGFMFLFMGRNPTGDPVVKRAWRRADSAAIRDEGIDTPPDHTPYRPRLVAAPFIVHPRHDLDRSQVDPDSLLTGNELPPSGPAGFSRTHTTPSGGVDAFAGLGDERSAFRIRGYRPVQQLRVEGEWSFLVTSAGLRGWCRTSELEAVPG